MEIVKNKKDRMKCILSAIIIVGSYAVQRLASLLIPSGKAICLTEAILFSLAVAVVYFIVIKAENCYYGLLPAIMGFRMLPPDISSLGEYSQAGELVYYIVSRFALVIFSFAIIRLYRKQNEEEKISVLSILALLFVVPFMSELGDSISRFIIAASDSGVLYSYFVKFACYCSALLIILFLAARGNKISAKLIADYTLVALCVNFARRAIIIAYNLINSNHISKSYFCWIAIYSVFFAAFYVIKKKKTA